MKIVEGTLRRDTSVKGQEITFVTKDVRESDKIFSEQGDKELEVIIRPVKKKRSLDANAYMWVLADKIAKKIGNDKEFVYRVAVKACGRFADVAIQNKAVNDYCENWKHNGVGWFTEMFDSKLENCKKIRCYYGTSIYTSAELSPVIDYIVNEAKELDIETMTPAQLESLKQEWGK